MASIEISLEGDVTGLDGILARLDNLSPALREIGEDLAESTRNRFRSGTAPDGTPWAPNSEATILAYLASRSGVYAKRGGLTSGGMSALLAKRPLIGETRNLATTIGWQVVEGGSTLLVGSPQKYAATQQFGASRGEYGRSRRGPIPWGDIPARPFLGVAPADRANILDILRDYIGG